MIGYEELYIYDVFESVILEMKSSGSIISIVDNSGTWTITTTDTGNLKDNFKVKIGSNYFRVQNVDSTFKKTFEIVTSTDLASETNWEMFIDFQLGSRVEVTNYLSQKDSNKKVDEKFDLIWLLNHSPESYETEINDIYKTVDYVLIFVTDSKRKYTSIERLTNSFKARLNPLFQLFIETLKESDYVLFNPGEEIGGNLTPYYFYGHEQKNENVVNEITDALEFSNKIKLKKQPIINC